MVLSTSETPVGSSILVGTRYSSLENVRKNTSHPYMLHISNLALFNVIVSHRVNGYTENMGPIHCIEISVTIDTILNLTYMQMHSVNRALSSCRNILVCNVKITWNTTS